MATDRDAQRDAERAEWNAALASGDPHRIAETRARLLASVNGRIMDDDPRAADAGWSPTYADIPPIAGPDGDVDPGVSADEQARADWLDAQEPEVGP